MSHTSPDPSPIADPNEDLRSYESRGGETGSAPPAGGTQWLAESAAATIAGILAGAAPMLVYMGHFDENRLFDPAASRAPAPPPTEQ